MWAELVQYADIETKGGVIAFDFDSTVARTNHGWYCTFQLPIDAVDCRTKANREFLVESIADSRLYGDNPHFTVIAMVAARESALVIGNQTERDVDANANSPFVVDR